ncbi:calponin homology domain-containing protein DDB_G0272472-like isoform X1 [Mercenaria mercenaria]|uniref:calponin homology domain-containing protein DDB_G0272472-like isoform X1 n=1 Tax=Mercenaria mercenaria TaxID=6596 RepID=UPI00234E6199|nr:calponin homology domain-containing protein DDB_G0272472-like isoform X1 [Mercenaria mercenaria]
MTSVVELTKVGKELGYEGEELRNFVKEEQARERDERHSRLEAEKDRLELEARLQKEKIEYERQSSLEAEKERLEAERVRLELEARLQKEKIEYERKLEQDKLEMEKDKLMLARKLETEKEEAESRKLETEHKFKTDLEKMSKKKVKVKMTPFDEKIDSMDAYLNVYETYAVAQDWDKEIWSLNLPFLLKGTAREVFDRLPLEDRKDYDKLKAALLRQFELTDDGYKKKFRTERPRDNETFVMFLARISRYLDGWLRLSKVEKTYEGLLDFILRDQFLDVCNRELYQNLSSKKLVKAKDVAEDADLFAKTRGGPKYVVNRTNKDRSYKPYEIPQRQYPSSRNVGTSNRGSSNVANRGRGYQPFGVLKCYKCGRIGHSSYYCRSGKYGGNSANAAAELEVEQEQESSKGENRIVRKIEIEVEAVTDLGVEVEEEIEIEIGVSQVGQRVEIVL